MARRAFGWTKEQIPAIGMGTWMIENHGRELAVRALQKGLDLGMTHIDTAEMYGNGKAEEIISDAILGRRDQVFLVSKVLPSNASYEGTIKACKKSLKRLRTRHLDLYLLHWPSTYPITETMRAMEELKNEGLIRYIGVSNFDVEDLQEAEAVLKNHRLACNQVMYHLESRGIEKRLLPYCAKRQIAVVGYSSFGHGSFPDPNSVGGKVLSKISERLGKTARQVALNFLTRPAFPLFAIPKSSEPKHVEENSGGMGWELSKEDISLLDEAFPVPSTDSSLAMI